MNHNRKKDFTDFLGQRFGIPVWVLITALVLSGGPYHWVATFLLAIAFVEADFKTK